MFGSTHRRTNFWLLVRNFSGRGGDFDPTWNSSLSSTSIHRTDIKIVASPSNLPTAASKLDIMAEPSIYDEIELEDLTYHSETTLYTYPCPCGDQFEITLQDLRDGEDIAVCPSCSLMIRVIFEAGDLPAEEQPADEGKGMVVEVAA